jgi:hypothetical protein
VEAETKKPQNQKHNENCPEHVDLLRAFECPENKGCPKLIYLVVAGASDFPHSRHDVFDRDVINPQNGHILCDA